MKKLIMLVCVPVLVFYYYTGRAQSGLPPVNYNDSGITINQVLDHLEDEPEAEDSSEGGRQSYLQRMRSFWTDRATANGSGDNMFTTYFKALNDALQARYAGTCTSTGKFQGNWSLLGPGSLDKQAVGFIDCIWSDPSNQEYVLAGTHGGLFQHAKVNNKDVWTCLTDNAVFSNGIQRITSIAVKPGTSGTSRVIYLGTQGDFTVNSDILGQNATKYGMGILKTADGGQTWQQETITGDPLQEVQKVVFSPDGTKLFAFAGTDIYTRAYTGTTWTKISPSGNDQYGFTKELLSWDAEWNDIQFVPNDANANTHFYVSSITWFGYNQCGVYEVKFNSQTSAWDFTKITDASAFQSYPVTKAGNFSPVSPTALAATTTPASGIVSSPYGNKMYFTVSTPTVLSSVDVYPNATTGSAASIKVVNVNTNATQTRTYNTNVTGGATAQTITLNFVLSPGSYYIAQGTAVSLASNIAAPTNLAYPFGDGVFSITGNDANNNANYYCFYNWKHPDNLVATLSIPTSSSLYTSWLSSDGIGYLARYDMSTSTWNTTLLNNNLPGNFHSWSREHIVVNPLNTNVIYYGTDQPYVSLNGGTDFSVIGAYNGNPTHGDIRGISLQTAATSSTNDILFLATDGGVSKKNAGVNPATSGFLTTNDISGTGLACAHTWSVAVSEKGGIVVGGTFHDGTMSYEKDATPQWFNDFTADSRNAIFDRTTPDKAMSTIGFGGVDLFTSYSLGTGRKIDGWSSAFGLPSESANTCAPLSNNASNELFLGMTNLHRRNGTSWLQISNTLGIPGISGTTVQNSPVKAFSFTPYTTGSAPVGYVIFDYDNTYTNSKSLYYRNPPALSNNNNFVNRIAPSSGPMIAVASDPQNMNRVWVTVGGVSGNTSTHAKDRVYYSSNGGTNWEDISDGLPPRMPASAIVFQEGGNYLYAATDVGVYMCDMNSFVAGQKNSDNVNTSVKWTCFSKGAAGSADFPSVYVTELTINYCTGKLFASTYGRSIWSTDLYAPGLPTNYAGGITSDDAIPGASDIINTPGTVSWAADRYIAGSIRIKAGTTLEIKNTGSVQTVIHMPKNGAIIVEPGAQLILNGAKITQECGLMWKGILVEGNSSLPQTGSNQGIAILKNNAVIEHARVGVVNWGESVDGLNTAGGIIQADFCQFTNNARGAAFAPYHNKYGATNILLYNKSYFKNCSFRINDQYHGEALNYPFVSHVTLSDVEGIVFAGNTFYNQATAALPNTQSSGIGINSWNSGFSVIPYCTSNPTGNYQSCSSSNYIKNDFQGVNVGIQHIGDKLNQYNTLWVDYATFDKNGLGVFVREANHFNVYHSSFSMGTGVKPYLKNCNCQKGIYATNTSQFRIEENSFLGHFAYVPYNYRTYGAEVDYTGAVDNDIYKNTFNELDYAGYNLGTNAIQYYAVPNHSYTGLQYRCNTFTNNTTDILANGGSPNTPGISAYMGNSGNPAGNTYSNAYYGLTKGVVNINTTNSMYNYYYASGTNPQVQGFSLFGPGSGNSPANIATSSLPQCASRPNIWPGSPVSDGGTGKLAAQQSFQLSKANWQSASATFQTKVDGGNTQSLLNSIASSTSADAANLRTLLLSKSPYLSQAVLIAMIDKNTMPLSMMMDVLNANPEVLRDASFIAYLQSGVSRPLPSDAIAQLMTSSLNTSAASADLDAMQDNYRSMIQAAGRVLTAVKMDTTGMNPDTMAYWYAQIPEPWARYDMVGHYLGMKDYSRMSSLLNNVPIEFNLTWAGLREFNAFKDYVNLIQNVQAYGRTETDLNATEISSLQEIADRNDGMGSSVALALLQRVNNLDPYICSDASSNGSRMTSQSPDTKETENILRVFPNPAKDHVSIDYSFPVVNSSSMMTVTDIAGRVIYQAELKDKEGHVWWDTKAVAPGNYLYMVKNAGKILGSGKLTIIK